MSVLVECFKVLLLKFPTDSGIKTAEKVGYLPKLMYLDFLPCRRRNSRKSLVLVFDSLSRLKSFM